MADKAAELTDAQKAALLAGYDPAEQARLNAEAKQQEADRKAAKRQFTDEQATFEKPFETVITGMEVPSGSSGFPKGPVASGSVPRPRR